MRLLQIFWAALLAALVDAASQVTAAQVPREAWLSLNDTLAGRVLVTTPIAAPCYNEYNEGPNPYRSAAQCNNITSRQNDADFLDSQFGTTYYTNWATCQADGSGCPVPQSGLLGLGGKGDNCALGGLPLYYIDVREVRDIQEGFRFAREHGIQVVVKNTGHDYQGRSVAPGALSLWTHNLRPPMTFDQSFVPEGCSAGESYESVITMGSGVGFKEVYDFANDYGRDIVAGDHPTVGIAGGWLTGGGHSVLSPNSGLGVDNAVQIRAVLPNGSLVTANRCQNNDLFFALRGGGGGTFGVITELTYKTLPQRPMQTITYAFTSIGPAAIKRFVEVVVENGETWAEQGWGGFFAPVANGRTGAIVMVNPRLNKTEATASIKPLNDFFSDILYFKIPIFPASVTFDSFHEVFLTLNPREKSSQFVGGGAALSSRLLPRSLFQSADTRASLTAALIDLVREMEAAVVPNAAGTQIPVLINLVGPANYSLPESDVAGGPGEASVTPAWRDSLWHVIAVQQWEASNTNVTFVKDQFELVSRVMQPLRDMTPESGAYVNEADTYEPNHEQSFWGAHYQRLMEIKDRIDPERLLVSGRQSVGVDRSGLALQCYPQI